MKNHLVLFTGLALASLAALIAVTSQRSEEAVTAGQVASAEATAGGDPGATAQKPAEKPATKVEAVETKPVEKPTPEPAKPAEATPPAEQPKTEIVEAKPVEQPPAVEPPKPAEAKPPAEQPKTELVETAPAKPQPEPPKTETAEAGSVEKPVAEADPQAAEQTAQAEKTPEPPKPEFDTVRIEADGNAIVAGQAEPGAEVTLRLDGDVIGKGIANEEGAWVVVPEAPLPKGAHEITAETRIAEAAAPVISDHSIAVAVPEDGKKQPMIAVLEPGEATKVIQKSAPEVEEQTVAAQPVEEPARKPEVAAPAKKPEAGPEPQVAVAEPEPSPEVAQPPPATKPEDAEPQVAVAEPQPEPPKAEQPPKPAEEESRQAALPAPEESTEAAPHSEPAPAEVKQPEPEAVPLSLDVVDYNDRGDIIFSGRAAAGAVVRLYVDNRPVGDALADANGNWSFAGSELIAPGRHSLRLDQIDTTGKVTGRIELPFLREDQKKIAALNEAEEAAKPPAEAKTEPPDAATSKEDKEEVTAPKQPGSVEKQEPVAEPPPAEQPAVKAAPEPGKQAAQPEPQQPQAEVAKPEPESMPESEVVPEAPKAEAVTPDPEPEPQQQAAVDPSKQYATEAEATAAAGSSVETAAAKPRIGRVVIQPRNNLWKLSRVIYGRGVHYTVIYEANREQIRNPDLIYPGQIFTIPNASPPEAIDPKRKLPLTAAEGGGSLE